MDPSYSRYAAVDAVFYDDPGRRVIGDDVRFHPATSSDWSAWLHSDSGHWSMWRHADTLLPEQGWKIHVSTTAAGARALLDAVSTYCHARRLPFKHLSHELVLQAVDAKDADRASSGKFLTVYPPDVEELRAALDALDALIGGSPGPRILSDLQWRSGPLSVRYGAFLSQTIRMDGREVAAIRRPDGTLVEDVRSAEFAPPEWAELPTFLRAELDALGADTPPEGFPAITGALHHSNGGGVYAAEGADGAEIVVKEGRPHAGLTPDGRDAGTRIRDEEIALRAVAAADVVGVRYGFDYLDHRFLVLDRVEGQSLNSALTTRHPLVRADPSPEAFASYRDWAVMIVSQVSAAVAGVHDRGYSHGDLHPANVLVTPDDRIVLIDFEMAQPIERNAPAIIGAPGFTPPDQRGGVDADRYALGCIALFLFLPLTAIIPLDRLKADELVTAAGATFGLDEAFLHGIRSDLGLTADAVRGRPGVPLTSTSIRSGIARALRADADFERTDRAWPGDPQQFATHGYGLAHGAAGIIHALSAEGDEPDTAALAWLDAAVARDLARGPRLGLCDGIAGVAALNRRLGRDAEADALVATLIASPTAHLGTDLAGGEPGIGLLLLDELDRYPEVAPLLDGIARRVRERYAESPTSATVATDAGGLLRGGSGAALFALRRFERTGDERDLDTAERAIEHDLAALAVADDGTLQINEGWRLMPYLGTGSAGVGWVLAGLLRHSDQADRYLELLDGIRRAASTEFTIQSGLFQGRAGLIAFLAALRDDDLATLASDRALDRHIAELRLHAIRRPEGIGFPGDGLLRLSCDLATGSAGVLVALSSAAPARSPWFPLLAPEPLDSSLRLVSASDHSDGR